jgi:hypothetical protein
MKMVEFRIKVQMIGHEQVTMKGKPVVHPDGRPVVAADLKQGETYCVKFDDDGPNAELLPRVSRAERRKIKSAGRRAL